MTAKLKFQDMAKQLSNLKRTRRDRIKCEKKKLKSSFGLIVLSSDFWISCHFVTVFRNISTFQDAICAFPKTVSTFVYHATPFQNSFYSQKTLKSKNRKNIFWNSKFYHPAIFELKLIKKCRPHAARGDHEMPLMTQLASRQKNENTLWRLNEVIRHPCQTLLRFSQTCELWSSKANWQLRFSLPSIILADLLGNKTLL